MTALVKHSGKLGIRLAAHLLRRATYHTSSSRIETFANYTAQQAVNELFKTEPLQYPIGPLSWESGKPMFIIDDYNGGAYRNEKAIENTRKQASFYVHSWRFNEMIADKSIRWKIVNWYSTLFTLWGSAGKNIYPLWRLFEDRAFKDLKSLAQKVTLDNVMLGYLNNSANLVAGPNENYAREFLELFTILRGPAIEIGNYTNYTEADISQAARVLTGFRIHSKNVDSETGIASGKAVITHHDKGDKTFSSAFQNRTIKGAKTTNDMYRELGDFVDMVFEQDETAKSFVRRMYRFFVADNISEEVEQTVIDPLATELKAKDYQHVDVLKKLLMSNHFYDTGDSDSTDNIIGSKVKSPYELLFQSITTFEFPNRNSDDLQYKFHKDYIGYRIHLKNIGLDPLGPETVEGYPGFYKEPNFSRNWISNNTFYLRFSLGSAFLQGTRPNGNGSSGYFPHKVDIVKWAKDTLDSSNSPGTRSNPIGVSNADYTVDKLISYMLPEKPIGSRYEYFRDSLLGGLSTTNWYFAWANYLSGEMDDSDVRIGLERLFNTLMSSPEYQTF